MTATDPLLTAFLTLSPTARCDLSKVKSVAPSFKEPVRSDLPFLVLGDEYDPVTRPSQSKMTAEQLAHAQFVLFPGLGHGAVFSDNPCPAHVFLSFLAHPGHADTGCVATMGPPKWVIAK